MQFSGAIVFWGSGDFWGEFSGKFMEGEEAICLRGSFFEGGGGWGGREGRREREPQVRVRVPLGGCAYPSPQVWKEESER